MNKRQRKKRDKKIRQMAERYVYDFFQRESPEWPGTDRFVELLGIVKADLQHKFHYDIYMVDTTVPGSLGFSIKPM